MTNISGQSKATLPTAEYELTFKTLAANASSNGGVVSFTASLDSTSRTGIDLSGLAGILVDTDQFRTRPIVVTVHEALRRHTGPKTFSVSCGAAAQHELDAGLDGRVLAATRRVLFLWLPEIYDESRRGAGTCLLEALRSFLAQWPDVTVLLDLGVEDEQDGYVRIFWPKLRKHGLELSKNGRFAAGAWPAGDGRQRPGCDVGFVHL